MWSARRPLRRCWVELRLSASQLRSFCQCQFAYYMEYVLHIKPQKPAWHGPGPGRHHDPLHFGKGSAGAGLLRPDERG